VFAEFEHATIVDRITAGIERRAREGRWYSGRPPFGYTLKDGQLAPDPITAPTVRRIYQLYIADRLGTIAIAHQLRAEHAPAPSAGWGHPAVHRILTNPTYLGRIRWRDQDFLSTHEPLVDQDTFDQAQAILTERGEDASRRRGNRSDFLLSGVVRCGHCGRAYIGMSARGKGGLYHYYACTARQKYGPKACQGQRVSREKRETAVLHQLTGIYRDGPLIQNALATAQQQAERERPALDERRQAITAEISRNEHATARYFDAFEEGRLSPERCEQRLADLTTRIDDLRAQQAELTDNDEDADTTTATDLAAVADQLEKGARTRRARANQGTPAHPHRRASRQQQDRHPADLPHRHARGLRNVRKSGDGGNRTHVRNRVWMASTSVAGALISSPTRLAGGVVGDQPP
jgi:site-specific DNA recombinase